MAADKKSATASGLMGTSNEDTFRETFGLMSMCITYFIGINQGFGMRSS